MKVNVRIAMMSHLSDAQHLIGAGMQSEANVELNFVKMMLLTYGDSMDMEVDSSELDKLYSELD